MKVINTEKGVELQMSVLEYAIFKLRFPCECARLTKYSSFKGLPLIVRENSPLGVDIEKFRDKNRSMGFVTTLIP